MSGQGPAFFCGKEPQLTLWTSSWTAHVKIKASDAPNIPNYCAIFII